jgi:hypothetical protein
MITIKKKALLLGVVFLIAITSVLTIVVHDIYWEYRYSQSIDGFNEWEEFEGEAILRKLTPVYCESANTLNDDYSCKNLIQENVLGWKSIDNCKDEWITFTFDQEYYVEFIVFENFQLDSQFMKTDKIEKLTISLPNRNLTPVTFELNNNKDSQWVDLNSHTDEIKFSVDSSYNNTTTVPCGIQTITFFGSESDNLDNG